MVNSGFNRAFGAALRRFISKSTDSRLKAFLSGIGATMILQSSTAAVLIISSFAGQGIIAVSSGIAIILGADVGTTLVAQVLSLDLSWLIPVLLTSGYIINKALKDGQYKHVGRAFIGIGLILLALKSIVAVSDPLRSSDVLQTIVSSLSSEPFLAIIFAVILTWLAHSSLAMILLFASFASTGTIPIHMGFLLVLGANLGGAIAPLVMTANDLPKGRRIPLANLIMRSIFVIAIVPFIDVIIEYLTIFTDKPENQLINFHMCFNVLLAMCFISFVVPISKLTGLIFPNKEETDSPNNPRYLDVSALKTPPSALSCAARETLRVSDYIQRMIREALEALRNHDMKLVQEIRERDNIVDDLYESIKQYMAKMSGAELDDKESKRYLQILTFATNLEHIGDVIDKSLMEMAAKKIRNQYMFSTEGFSEICNLHANILENLSLAQNLFMSGDLGIARRLVEEKAIIRKQEAKASANHIERLRKGVTATMATSSLHLDILRDLSRINSYLTMIAYPILREAGELHKTLLRTPKATDDIQ